MMLPENTVPALTIAGEAACGSRLLRNETSNGCRSRTAVDTRSARACPLVPNHRPADRLSFALSLQLEERRLVPAAGAPLGAVVTDGSRFRGGADPRPKASPGEV